MGPITVFDKSFLQSLSVDEAVWFDYFFYTIITPLFYIECLADLESSPKSGQTPENHLSLLAIKAPQIAGTPCHFHQTLYINDLLGNSVPLKPHIPIAGAKNVIKDGEIGTIVRETNESKAFHRWNKKQYTELERTYAREWRANIAKIDLNEIKDSLSSSVIKNADLSNLELVNKLSDKLVLELTKSSARFDSALEILNVPPHLSTKIKARWKKSKKPTFNSFAPYAAHVLKVTIFFSLAVTAGHISSDRATNQVDIAYFFYAPLCHIFVSSDKLHRTCAPFLLRSDQTFVWGQELKADIKSLNGYFQTLSDDVKNEGIYSFARVLPKESNGLIRQLFERHTPNLLSKPPNIPKDPSKTKDLIEMVNQWTSAQVTNEDQTPSAREVTAMVIERMVSPSRGSWIQIKNKDG